MKHMTLQDAKALYAEIAQHDKEGDYEAAHAKEDGLYHRVLEMLAKAETIHQFRHAQKLAKIALLTEQLDFARHCA